jgi:hypothetical protein
MRLLTVIAITVTVTLTVTLTLTRKVVNYEHNNHDERTNVTKNEKTYRLLRIDMNKG